MSYKMLGISGEVEVRIINRDSYIAVRSIANNQNADIEWIAEKGQVVISTDVIGTPLEVILHSNGRLAIVNGNAFILREPIRNIDGTLYIQTHSLVDIVGAITNKPMTATIVRNVLEIK
ncbi:stalk domain-containing protein [Desulfuribacillus alkaliarsenatis]|uniref:Copper amine oxidase-like N-terminal domain-containing protein n=1 Tax=Desulfuribacillus alkaliarsenatis TaxID=766136 RepID=A0A1E5G0V5_9FIRM|nr:stalk domain-containing protein [Desulfuribacillus alkaliarsenatis]OEF96536.1 hypothetical protein BHF68_07745 [Desulfuribacillus alkaliarsenatis]